MGDHFWTVLASFLVAIIGLATLSVVLGSSNTSSDIQAFSSGFASILNAATNPSTSLNNGNNGLNAQTLQSAASIFTTQGANNIIY
jgi:hypothetical protein